MPFANLLDQNTFSRRDTRTLGDLLLARREEERKIAQHNADVRRADLANDFQETTFGDRASDVAAGASMKRDDAAMSSRGRSYLEGLPPYLAQQPRAPAVPPPLQFGPQQAPDAPMMLQGPQQAPNLPPQLAPPSREQQMYEAARAGVLPQTSYFQLTKPEDGGAEDTPMTVKEWKYYSALPPEDQARFIEMKRAQKTLDLGGESVVLGQGGEVSKRYQKSLKPGELPSVKGAQAAAVEAGKESVTGKNAREQKEAQDKHQKALMAKQGEVESLGDFLTLVSRVEANPNLAGATGWGKMGRLVPGSQWADVDADINRIVGSGAIETMAKLKRESPTGSTGFGALSEKELGILQSAFSSLGDRNISPPKMREELRRVRDVTQRYLTRVQQFQGTPADEKAKVTDADIDTMSEEDLIRFLETN